MKKITVVFLSVIFFNIFLIIACLAENRKEAITNASSEDAQKVQQASQQRPILPPVVPGPLPSISPIPSPNIAMPPITPNTMDVQRINKINADIQFRNPQASIPILPSLPKLPVLPPSTSIAKSVSSVPILPQKIQLIKSLLGIVINIGSEKDDILWLDVRGRFSNETVRINVNSKKTRVIKKDATLTLKDIKIGDMIRVIYNQAGKKIPVNVISIISEEELKKSAYPK